MIGRRAFGRRICGADAARLEVDPSRSHRLALRVLGMESAKSPDIAQVAHEEVLGRFGCLAENVVLRYSDLLPAGKTFDGVYLGDRVVLGIVPLSVWARP